MVVGYIVPDSTISTDWDEGCNTTNPHLCIDEYPSLGADHLIESSKSTTKQSVHGLTTLASILDNSVSQLKVCVNCLMNGALNNFYLWINTNKDSTWRALVNGSMVVPRATLSYSYTGLSYSQADVDDLQVGIKLKTADDDPGEKYDIIIDQIYTVWVEVTYTAGGWSAGDPTGVDVATVSKIKGVELANIGNFLGV